jgi:hypothetical protein
MKVDEDRKRGKYYEKKNIANVRFRTNPIINGGQKGN